MHAGDHVCDFDRMGVGTNPFVEVFGDCAASLRLVLGVVVEDVERCWQVLNYLEALFVLFELLAHVA